MYLICLLVILHTTSRHSPAACKQSPSLVSNTSEGIFPGGDHVLLIILQHFLKHGIGALEDLVWHRWYRGGAYEEVLIFIGREDDELDEVNAEQAAELDQRGDEAEWDRGSDLLAPTAASQFSAAASRQMRRGRRAYL
jgi:hypothetical protein